MNIFRIPNLSFLATVLTCVYLGVLPWREQRQIELIENEEYSSLNFERFSYRTNASHTYINKKLLEDNVNLDDLELLGIKSIKNRPFYAYSWLDLAKINLRQGDLHGAITYAEKAQQLWSTESYLLYLIGSFWLQMGDFDRAIKTLGKYLSTDPVQVRKTLNIVRLLESDTDRLLQLLFSNESIGSNNREQLLRRVFSISIRENRTALATSLWNQFNSEMFSDDKLSMKYLNFLIKHNDIEQAISVWSQYTDNLKVEDIIVNGGFESELINGGFGWKVRSQQGVEWNIDTDISFEGNNSLKLDFKGQDNISYLHTQQIIPVEYGGRYKLTAYWRGESVTTRSTPFIHLSSIGGAKTIHSVSKSKRGSWSWEKLSVEIEMPKDSNLLGVSVRRKKTKALDKNISGAVWLDEFRLEKL